MLLPDYDPKTHPVIFEDINYSGNLVDAPIIWKVGRVIRYLHDDVFREASRAVNLGLDLSSLLISFSIVEYLAGFYAGRQSKAEDFINFINDFFPEKYRPFSSSIYEQLRNGLVHNLTLLNPWLTSNHEFIIENNSEDHLSQRDKKVVISIKHFLYDIMIAHGLHSYLIVMKPRDYPDLIKNFEKRFNKKDGTSSTMMKVA